MKEYLTQMVKLSVELDAADGVHAIMVMDEMTALYNKHITELIAINSRQNVLNSLLAYDNYLFDNGSDNIIPPRIQVYLENLEKE